MKRLDLLIILAVALAATGCAGGCTATATPHDTEGPPPDKPVAAEILVGLVPALDGFAQAADNFATLAVRERKSTACLVWTGAESGLRSIGAAFTSLDPKVGAVPLCEIPGVAVDLSACDELLDFVPLVDAEAVAEVDRVLAPALPAVRGMLATGLGIAGTSEELRAWLDAGMVYLDNVRAEGARYLKAPDGRFRLPAVPVLSPRCAAATP